MEHVILFSVTICQILNYLITLTARNLQ